MSQVSSWPERWKTLTCPSSAYEAQNGKFSHLNTGGLPHPENCLILLESSHHESCLSIIAPL